MLSSIRNRIVVAFVLIIISVIGVSAFIASWSAEHQLEEFVGEISQRRYNHLGALIEIRLNVVGHLEDVSQFLLTNNMKRIGREPSLPTADLAHWDSLKASEGIDHFSAIMAFELTAMGDAISYAGLFQRWQEARMFVMGEERSVVSISTIKSTEFRYSISATEPADGREESEDHEQESRERVDSRGEHQESNEHSISLPLQSWVTGEIEAEVVFADSNEFGEESSRFTKATLYNLLWGGIITAILALGMSFWLASRINIPIAELTKAAERIVESGTMEHIAVRSNDELGKMSITFNKMTDSLTAQKQVREKLIEDISHELNTPLSIIKLEAKGIANGMQEPKQAAINIEREVDLLSGLIGELELIAETEKRAVQVQLESIDLDVFLNEIVQRWQSKAVASGVVLSLDLGPIPASATFDGNRMRQVLDNLIKNALQHTDKAGTVVLKGTVDDQGATLSVTDSGTGIAEGHLPHVFDRSFRIGKGQQGSTNGRGLGLAIAKHIVDLHRGEISVVSKQGEGSSFVVSIPTTTGSG